ncbi:MAG: zinc-binding alcohol dehydrogenase family protein [Limisphaerales bacterium]|jgi:2-desacetyl-2-hydroxyethyl bacteriochlorophyllide A dehydrogenase|nr:zinc-binding alcohol dehydrogenase family protein [Verrucomicrobiota bacterium]
MKALQFTRPQLMESISIDEPSTPGPGQALVRVHRIGICGTDLSGYMGKMPFFTYPRIPGHELGVEVIATGKDVTHVQPGDRCSIEPYMHCGQCFPCQQGSTNCCEQLKVIGVMEDGGMRERFLVRASKLHPGNTLSYDQLALVETLAIGCHATNRGEPSEGMKTLIIGAGPIGLATLEFVRLTGARITVMDRVETRLQFCRDIYGVAHTILHEDDEQSLKLAREYSAGDRYQLVIDATGNQHSMSQALQYVAHTGTLVYVGITTQEIKFAHPILHRAEINLKASRNALPSDFTRIIGLIDQGTIQTDPWITHRTSFEDTPKNMEHFTQPASGVIKAIIEV